MTGGIKGAGKGVSGAADGDGAGAKAGGRNGDAKVASGGVGGIEEEGGIVAGDAGEADDIDQSGGGAAKAIGDAVTKLVGASGGGGELIYDGAFFESGPSEGALGYADNGNGVAIGIAAGLENGNGQRR